MFKRGNRNSYQKFDTKTGGKLKKKQERKWMDRHVNDPYVKSAKLQRYRSRAAFKLMDIDKDGVINKNDLRAAFDNVGK